MPLLHLDLEVFNYAPFGSSKQSVGLWNYARHPSAEILLAGFAVDDSPVQVLEGFMPRWVVKGVQQHPHHPELSFPWTMAHELLYRALQDPAYTIVAFNAEFERVILRYVAGLPLDPSRFLCSMAKAWSMSFVGGLDEIAKEMGFPPDMRKLARGKRMMQKFTKPRKPSAKNPRTRWLPDDDPEGWAEFRGYGGQDVEISRETIRWGNRYPWRREEREMWVVDQYINDLGWPIDVELVATADETRKHAESLLLAGMKRLTGLANPNSRDQLLGWLHGHGYELENLQAETVTKTLNTMQTLGVQNVVREVLELRQQLSAQAPKKLGALRRNVCDGRLRASLEFGAAQRTQRWGGRVAQPHNLFSEREYDPLVLADILRHASPQTAQALFGANLLRVLKGVVRPCITAPPDYTLACSDLSSIESRLLGWHSGEERINGIFARGEDTYRDLASRIFRKPVDAITKEERTFAKPGELGAGYKLSGSGRDGTGGLVAYAASMGVPMTAEEGDRVIGIWRDANPAVVTMWKWFDDASWDVVANNAVHSGYRVRLRRDENFFFIDLPSGRSIYYFRPEMARTDWGNWTMSYMGRYQDEGGRWQRVHTHAGKITENIIQSVARDILRDSIMSAWLNGLQVVGHVHDEIIVQTLIEKATAVLAQLNAILSSTPSWAPGLLLASEGFLTPRFVKH